MLRAQSRQQIVAVLENSYFGLDNFLVEFPLNSDILLFKISFVPTAQFSFVAHIPDKDGDIYTTECPAIEFVKAKTFLARGFSKTVDRLEQWTERVKEEVISANPFSRELVAFKEEIDRRLVEMQVELDSYFTATEVSELSSRLSQFESRLSELEIENESLSEAIGSLSKTVEDLKLALGAVNRGTWFRMSASRLLSGLKAVATSKEGRELALEAAKKLLLEGPK